MKGNKPNGTQWHHMQAFSFNCILEDLNCLFTHLICTSLNELSLLEKNLQEMSSACQTGVTSLCQTYSPFITAFEFPC